MAHAVVGTDDCIVDAHPLTTLRCTGDAPPPARGAHVQLLLGELRAVRWRLLSGNNRELGRGVQSSPGVEECLALLGDLRARVELTTARIQRSPSGQWSWDVLVDGTAVATASHSYPRLIRCRQGLAKFLASFADAQVGGVPVDTAARRWTTSHRSPGAPGRPSW